MWFTLTVQSVVELHTQQCLTLVKALIACTLMLVWRATPLARSDVDGRLYYKALTLKTL